MALPNLIIAGVNKAGTTSLFSYLALHPEIGASKIKETCYFLPLRYAEPMAPLKEYAAQFEDTSGERHIMESTPGYFYGGKPVAQAIKKTLGDTHIILMLREPVGRLLSFYRFKKTMLELAADLSLESYLEHCRKMSEEELSQRENNVWFGIEGGRYANYIEPWFEVFGERLKVVFFDDLRTDTPKLLHEICRWLKIDESVYDEISLGVENKTVQFRNRTLQRIALWVNDKGERFFRSSPGVKRVLRRWYQSMNTAQRREIISDDQKARAKDLFLESNRQLNKILTERGYTNLPTWLEQNTHKRG